jgi:hypothetical protein
MRDVSMLLLISAVYWLFAVRLIYTTNKEPQRQDQKHNMRRSLEARDQLAGRDAPAGVNAALLHWMPRETDGVVAPLWPWVAARITEPGHVIDEANFTTDTPQDMALFRSGKWLNVGLTLGVVWLLGLYSYRKLGFLAATNLTLLCAFGAFLPRAVYFQPEPLFYTLFLLAWLCALKLLQKNTLWLHVLFGIVCGLAYLAKTSIEPLILGWFCVATYRFFLGCIRPRPESPWCGRCHFIGCLAFAFSYLGVIAPNLSWNQEKFGNPFHTYPRYWMWMDNFDRDGYKWMQEHNNAEKLTAIPPEQIPNRKNYLKTHPWPQWYNRLTDGTFAKVEQFLAPKPELKKPSDGWKRMLDLRGAYLGVLALVLVLAAAVARAKAKSSTLNRQPFSPEAGSLALLCIGLFFAYSVAFGWYHVIGRGDRFMLMLYAPLAFSIIFGLERIRQWLDLPGVCRWFRWVYFSAHGLVFLALAGRLAWLLWDLQSNRVWFDPDVL